jgi:hypothetical protein
METFNRYPCTILTTLFVGGSSVAPPNSAAAGVKCKEIKATQAVIADLSTFTTTGAIRGDLKGTTQFTGDATSLAPISGLALPPLNPTFSYTGDLVITTQKGTLTTRSVGMFEFVPFGAGAQFDRVIGGTGKFQGATGLLYFTFRANGDLSGFTSSVTGELCLEEANND